MNTGILVGINLYGVSMRIKIVTVMSRSCGIETDIIKDVRPRTRLLLRRHAWATCDEKLQGNNLGKGPLWKPVERLMHPATDVISAFWTCSMRPHRCANRGVR